MANYSNYTKINIIPPNETSDNIIINFEWGLNNKEKFIELVKYSTKEILLIQSWFEQIPHYESPPDGDSSTKHFFEFIKENKNNFKIVDQVNFDKVGYRYYIKYGLGYIFLNSNKVKRYFEYNFNAEKKCDFIFLANSMKVDRVKIFNWLIENGYGDKVAIKFNLPDLKYKKGLSTDSVIHKKIHKLFGETFNGVPIIELPYKNELFVRYFGHEKFEFNTVNYASGEFSNMGGMPVFLFNAIDMLFESKIFISNETIFDNFCLTEKSFHPFLTQSIPFVLSSEENYKALKELGFYLDFFDGVENFQKKLKELLDTSSSDLRDFYISHKDGIIHNHRLIIDILTN